MELSVDTTNIPNSRGGFLPPNHLFINIVKCNEDIDTISATIAHEYIHYILRRDEPSGTSSAFDNIAYSAHSQIAFDQYLYNPYRPVQTKFTHKCTFSTPNPYPHYIK